mmetsp:Transcript_28308/g.42277  ORF Transcript_28308/g.42277 Transcript_28308/m.42277 type:complete len:98 (-) Transcript_28308:80-373(-)
MILHADITDINGNNKQMDKITIITIIHHKKKEMWNLSDNMGPYKTSTMLDLKNRKPMEVKYLFRKAVDRANHLNVPVPHLETLVMQIEAFQRFHSLY